MSSTEVVCLEKSQIDAASEIIARAFNDDPIFRYFAREQKQARINTAKKYKLHYQSVIILAGGTDSEVIQDQQLF